MVLTLVLDGFTFRLCNEFANVICFESGGSRNPVFPNVMVYLEQFERREPDGTNRFTISSLVAEIMIFEDQEYTGFGTFRGGFA